MRIESVTAHAFGPFHEQRLDLAPGMNVVGGPNEAGKSSWHAALRAALCGMRRARGSPTKEEQTFAELHKPWDAPDRWSVEARLTLDRDGRRIEIRQDLADRVASTAVELPLGRNVADEIMNDGSPDGSIWLGLDRNAFARTICVDQADMLAVTREARQLQDWLQQAAAAQGTDATAAEALERLRLFRSEAVGVDRSGSIRPLRQATVALEDSRSALDRARRDHEAYLALQAEADDARRAHDDVATRLRLLEAAVAGRSAARAAGRVARARELEARHPAPPAGMPERDELADEVATALAAWQDRPLVPDLAGDDSEAIRQRIAALPEVPEGDREVHAAVADAFVSWRAAGEAVEQLGDRPLVEPAPDAGGLTDAALEGLASDLEAAIVRPDVEPELRPAEAAASPPSPLTGLVAALVLAVMAGAAALVSLLAGAVALAAVLGAAAALLAVVAVGRGRRQEAARAAAERTAAELEPTRIAAAAAEARRAEARSRAERAGVPADAAALRALAREIEAHDRAARAAADWDERRARALEQQARAAGSLRASLRARGEPAEGEMAAAVTAYQRRCAERAEAARQATQGDVLRAAMDSRLEAERGAAEAAARVDEARRRLLSVAGRVGVATAGIATARPDEAGIVDRLQAWQRAQSEERAAREAELREWEELRALLEGGSLDDLQARADAERRRADRQAADVDAAALGAISLADDADDRLPELREAERASKTTADDLEGRRRERVASLADVAVAEETVSRAEEELARVRRLERTVDTTVLLLERAQERVHRDVAGILVEAIRPLLASVTAGRYDEVTIDPADLAVSVKEEPSGRWRDARLLSQGTSEQVYLLLRAAMAQHLVRPGETAPLLLDEVTAQADDVRRQAVLEVLREISMDRQVVLFTHDADVVDWARRSLDPTRDRLIELETPTA